MSLISFHKNAINFVKFSSSFRCKGQNYTKGENLLKYTGRRMSFTRVRVENRVEGGGIEPTLASWLLPSSVGRLTIPVEFFRKPAVNFYLCMQESSGDARGAVTEKAAITAPVSPPAAFCGKLAHLIYIAANAKPIIITGVEREP